MRGRKKKRDVPIPRRVHIPTSIDDRINEILEDPVLKKPPLGARSNLITQLLREFIRSLDKPVVPTDDELLAQLRQLPTDDAFTWNGATQELVFNLLKAHGYGRSLDYMAKVSKEI